MSSSSSAAVPPAVERFELYPAIDLRGGRCVRLYQGDYGKETVYGDDPVAQAEAFAAAGSAWIHVVDLDAARTGIAENRKHIAAIAEAVSQGGVRVQTGGGVRSEEAAESLLSAGVARVVIGTAALEQPELVRTLAARYPGRVAVGLDARGRDVAVRGWVEGSGQDLIEVAQDLAAAGIAALVVTEIGRDGTLEGPDVEGLSAVLEAVAASGVDVIASGGVGTLADIEALARLTVGEASARLGGVIVGRALYEGAFDVAGALASARVGDTEAELGGRADTEVDG